MEKIKVMIIADSKFSRTLFAGLLEGESDFEVISVSEYKEEIYKEIKDLKPDVLVLDMDLQNIDGLTFLKVLLKSTIMPVVAVSEINKRDAGLAISALELGVVDYIAKPNDIEGYKNIAQFSSKLLNVVRIAASCDIKDTLKPSAQVYKVKAEAKEYKFIQGKIITIGGSIGGIDAIREILIRMPQNCPPIVITQYMTECLTSSLAIRLKNITELEVKEVVQGEKLVKGHVYISPSNKGVRITSNHNKGYVANLYDNISAESLIDTLFESVSMVAGDKAVGVILSGFSMDGAQGLLKIKEGGGFSIGQSKETCILYDKTKAALDIGAVSEEVPVQKIADKICSVCME
jgi:two-component system chemotaxis response regulator CheB